VAACPQEAITKRVSDGLVLVDETLCIRCEACVKACTFGVPQFEENGAMQKCDLCCNQQLAGTFPPCVDTCSGKALSLIKVSRSEKMVHEKTIAQLLRSG
jgi:anaerobic dimethyl sulfoxide reductase subunit B (iron-sulfur subunit)